MRLGRDLYNVCWKYGLYDLSVYWRSLYIKLAIPLELGVGGVIAPTYDFTTGYTIIVNI